MSESQNTAQVIETLKVEAKQYPDRKTNLESRTFLLEQLYREAGATKIKDPRVIVLGAGRGADLLALKKVNKNSEFVRAVDAFPPEKPHNIVDSEGNVLATTVESEIVDYMTKPESRADFRKANLVVGTRLGPNTIRHIIDYLPRERGYGYLAIFTTDDSNPSKQREITSLLDSLKGDFVSDYYESENGMETVYRLTPNQAGNPLKEVVKSGPQPTLASV